ncbi:hypothetical protein PaeCFBP13512_16465 [Paenibacillus sp. CFBP13512]|uniref:hypothetical protein n=1 Tax=Paenibacillus sp. CFBP13512 TaxID=2184007 RepID=UPI0010BFF407|nr:hypothetical protein [Paenibacillus sp. CFBP13512]TKJ89248.1 hypothetical protein PaeCFBP13512_16465 [Paenibacillus sp. CFBP13512]
MTLILNIKQDIDRSVQQWHEQFAEDIAPLGQGIRNVQYTTEALALIFQKGLPNDPVEQALFKLNTYLYMLQIVVQPVQNKLSRTMSSLGYHTHLAVAELQKSIESLFAEPLPLTSVTSIEQREWLSGTLSYIRVEMLSESRDSFTFFNSYMRIWINWILPVLTHSVADDTELTLQAEVKLLEQLEPRSGHSALKQAWWLAQSYIQFERGAEQDEASLALIRTAATKQDFYPDRLPDYLERLSDQANWTRLAYWLTELADVLRQQQSNLQDYALYWEQVITQLPEAEPQMWTALEKLLPVGGRIYEQKLLSYGKWQLWMDYQLSAGNDPANYKVTELQPLENNAPEMLLPFYHQAVERHMAHKNRQGYKAAVKLLKRLAKLYKKIKQEPRWNDFIEQFAQRNSRLRALQEELRKGKLIP